MGNSIHIFLPIGLGDFIAITPLIKKIQDVFKNFNYKIYLSSTQAKLVELVDFPIYRINLNIVNELKDYLLINQMLKDDNIIDFSGYLSYTKQINLLNYYYFGGLTEIFSFWGLGKSICTHPNIILKTQLEEECTNIIKKYNLPTEYIVIHRFSLDPTRQPPQAVWNFFLKKLNKKLNLPIVELGSKYDINKGSLKISTKYYYDLRGKTSIKEVFCIIKNANLFMGVDSFLAHLANAFKIKGIVFLGKYMGRFSQYLPYCGFYRKKSNLFVIRYAKEPISNLTIKELVPHLENLWAWLEANKNGNELYNPYDLKGNTDFLNFIYNSNSFILWGAGNLGIYCYNFLRKLNKKVLYFVDSNKQGYLLGNRIISPQLFWKEFDKRSKILICTSYGWNTIANFLKSKGLIHFVDFI